MKEIKIIQITTDLSGDKDNFESGIYGLGEDNNMYYWSANDAEWKLWTIKTK